MSSRKRPRRGQTIADKHDEGVGEEKISTSPYFDRSIKMQDSALVKSPQKPSPSLTSALSRKQPRRGQSNSDVHQNDSGAEEVEEEEDEEESGTSPYFDKSKKKQEVSLSRRAASHARVARSRAAHFARLPVSSSCPTGVVQKDKDDDKDGAEESWPGPFSTANDMLKKRESAKLARETAIAEKDKQKDPSNMPVGDVYEQLLHVIATDSSSRDNLPLSIFTSQSSVPRLSNLAITTLATWWEHVEALGNLPTASLAALGSELSKQRKLSPQAVCLMFPTADPDTASDPKVTTESDLFGTESIPVHRMILLSDCSALDEECIFNVVYGSSAQLESLDLKNCGHVMTSHLVDRLVAANVGRGHSLKSSTSNVPLLSLETLSLTGMYRLQDEYLSKFFTQLIAPNRLHTLDLSKNSCLAHDGVMTLLQCGIFSQLTTLILDCTLLHASALAVVRSEEEDGEEAGASAGREGNTKLYEENAITLLCRGHHAAFPFLTSLSLGGVSSLSDSDVALLLTPPVRNSSQSGSSTDPVLLDVGSRLEKLVLRECPLLTDRALATIRTRCRSLLHLDLSHLPLVTTAALVGLFMQVKYVAPVEAASPPLSSGIERPTAVSRSIGPLRHLALEGLSKSVTDDVVMEACLLSCSAGNGLRVINISGCNNVTDKALAALSHHCSHTLEVMNFSFLRLITVPVLLYLLSMCTKEDVEVTIWGCSQLRRAVMESVQQQCPASDDGEREAGSVLKQLNHMKKMTKSKVGGCEVNAAVDHENVSYPRIIGFLDF